MFSHCGTSVGEEKEGDAFFLSKPSHSWERFLIRASDVYFVISADLQDVPPVLDQVYINKQIHTKLFLLKGIS